VRENYEPDFSPSNRIQRLLPADSQHSRFLLFDTA
jgi:hypothetical protein